MWAKEFGGMLSKLAWFSILIGAFINLQIVRFFLTALKLPLKTRKMQRILSASTGKSFKLDPYSKSNPFHRQNSREAAVAAATAFCTPVEQQPDKKQPPTTTNQPQKQQQTPQIKEQNTLANYI
jgi:hypothetical protein